MTCSGEGGGGVSGVRERCLGEDGGEIDGLGESGGGVAVCGAGGGVDLFWATGLGEGGTVVTAVGVTGFGEDNNGELDDHSRICCFPLPVYLLIIALRYMIRREYCMLTIHY